MDSDTSANNDHMEYFIDYIRVVSSEGTILSVLFTWVEEDYLKYLTVLFLK